MSPLLIQYMSMKQTSHHCCLQATSTLLPLKKRAYYIVPNGEEQEEIASRQGQDDEKNKAHDVDETIKKHTNGQMKEMQLFNDDTNVVRRLENGFCHTAFADGFNNKSTMKDIVAWESATAYSTGTATSTDWNEIKVSTCLSTATRQ